MELLNKSVVAVMPYIPRKVVRVFAAKYIAGEELSDAVTLTKKLNQKNIMSTIDVLGEFVTKDSEAVESKNECLNVLDAIHNNNLASNLSVKLTHLGLGLNNDLCWDLMKEIHDRAKKYNIFVRIDMENSPYTDDTINIYYKSKEYYDNCGIVVQAYLHRTYDDVQNIINSGIKNPNFRLCKGIYRESPEIAYQTKNDINDNFMKVLKLMLDKGAYVGIATHDDPLLERSYQLIKEMKLDITKYEFQMLLGVKENRRDQIVADGHRMRIYVPYGYDWFGYSYRRFKENPSIAGYVIKSMFGIGNK